MTCKRRGDIVAQGLACASFLFGVDRIEQFEAIILQLRRETIEDRSLCGGQIKRLGHKQLLGFRTPLGFKSAILVKQDSLVGYVLIDEQQPLIISGDYEALFKLAKGTNVGRQRLGSYRASELLRRVQGRQSRFLRRQLCGDSAGSTPQLPDP